MADSSNSKSDPSAARADDQVLLRPGLFKEVAGGRSGQILLKGNRCPDCGRTFFPARKLCPDCFDKSSPVPAELKGRGRIYASTVVRIPAPVGIAAPYAYGYVELEESGVRVFALFTGAEPDWFQPGRRVEAVSEAVRRDDDGREVIGYKFRPLTGEVAHG